MCGPGRAGGSSAFRGGLAQNRPTQALPKPVPHKHRLPPARCPPSEEGGGKDARAPPLALGSVFPSQHGAGSPLLLHREATALTGAVVPLASCFWGCVNGLKQVKAVFDVFKALSLNYCHCKSYKSGKILLKRDGVL